MVKIINMNSQREIYDRGAMMFKTQEGLLLYCILLTKFEGF